MGTVYLARVEGEGGFERLYALKVMHPHFCDEEEFVAMFLDEARLAARIRHPNVVSTNDVQRSGDALFLVMDYVEGSSLQQLLRGLRKRGAKMPRGIALQIVLDMLGGLHAAHELTGPDGAHLNLVHRDVSPQNLLVGKDGTARIADFGVARAEARLSSTRGGEVKGKVAYMAPEQLSAKPLDRRVDIYAAGAVMWETLVGRRLVKAPHQAALVAIITQGTLPSMRSIDPTIPEAIDQVCMRALSRNPDDRYGTTEELADAIESAADAAGIPLASSRVIAKYLKAVAPVPPDAPSQPRASSPSSSQRIVTDATPSSTNASAAVPAAPVSSPSGPQSVSQPSWSGVDSVSTRHEAVLTAAGPDASSPLQGRRRRKTIAAIAAAAAAGAVIAVVALVTFGEDEPTGSQGAPAGTQEPRIDSPPTAAPTAPTAAAKSTAAASSDDREPPTEPIAKPELSVAVPKPDKEPPKAADLYEPGSPPPAKEDKPPVPAKKDKPPLPDLPKTSKPFDPPLL